MLTPEQQQLYSSTLQQVGPDFTQGYQDFLQPKSVEDYQDVFQQSYIDPALQVYQQQVLPSIQQRFVDANAGSSSALNQALTQSATDLSTALGSQFGQFMQNQEANRLSALGGIQNLASQQTFSPLIQQRPGVLPGIIQAAGNIGGGYMMSSRDVKKNIRDYNKSFEDIQKIHVKQYDYIDDVSGLKDRIGLIAEDLPEELTGVQDGILCVDTYGLLCMLINTVKEMDTKIKQLQERC